MVTMFTSISVHYFFRLNHFQILLKKLSIASKNFIKYLSNIVFAPIIKIVVKNNTAIITYKTISKIDQ